MTISRRAMAACVLAITLAVAGAVSHANEEPAAAALHAADDAWIKAYNAGQVESVVALYDENAVIYTPGVAPSRGRAAIRAFFTKDMAEFAKMGLTMTLDAGNDGGVSGDTGWSSGTWAAKDKAGKVVDSGWYFSVSRKVGGKWLYVRDAWDSNGPAPPASPADK